MRSLFRHHRSPPSSEPSTSTSTLTATATGTGTAGTTATSGDALPSVTGAPRIPPISTGQPGLGLPFPVPSGARRSVDPPSPRSTTPEVDPTLPRYYPTLRIGDTSGPSAPASIPIAIPSRPSRTTTGVDSAPPIPSYEDALSESAESDGLGPLRRGSFGSELRPSRTDFLGSSPLPIAEDVIEEDAEDTDEEDQHDVVSSDDDDDDPLIPRRPSDYRPRIIHARRNTIAVTVPTPNSPTADTPVLGLSLPADGPTPFTVDLPPPPPNALPAYSAHLAIDELRLISTVHLDQNHPAAAFFAALTASSIHATAEPPSDPQLDQTTELSTGGKKLKLALSRGGYRASSNATGPVYVKIGRRGVIEGRIEVGKIDHGTTLEIAVLGLVNTSYYVRGQYTIIDTMPLVRRSVKLFPPGAVEDNGPNMDSLVSSASDVSGTSPTSGTSALPTDPSAVYRDSNGVPLAPTMSKDGQAYLTPGMVFPFSITMPNKHWRDEAIEIPPTCQIFQVGMQAGVEYVLRIKLARKGWRMNETMTVPIIYEPRAYLSPRRLRALTVDDPLNPGWRSILLRGGGPSHKTATNASEPPGVQATLLLPSPPIMYVANGSDPPPIPFHLHFHSPESLPLSTFSDPRESDYVVRLMRVATMRIGAEREIRRMEVPSKVELWQEGGPRMTLGEERLSGSVGDARGYPSHLGTTSTSGSRGGNTNANDAAAKARRRSSSDRRLSFLRRHSRSEPVQPQRTASAITENAAAASPDTPTSAPTSQPQDDSTSPTAAADGAGGTTNPSDPSPFTPLALGSTDVHLLGQLTVHSHFAGTEVVRKLMPSFQTPELGVSYVLEIGISPKKGAVKEAFNHVWGGGLIEVVLGPRA